MRLTVGCLVGWLAGLSNLGSLVFVPPSYSLGFSVALGFLSCSSLGFLLLLALSPAMPKLLGSFARLPAPPPGPLLLVSPNYSLNFMFLLAFLLALAWAPRFF